MKKVFMRNTAFFTATLICLSCVLMLAACAGAPASNQDSNTVLGPLPQGSIATTKSGFKVYGPITGGKFNRPFGAYFGDISVYGYVEEEYFIEGLAQLYEPDGELPVNGKWNLLKTDVKPYRTRMLVRRPVDPAKFNGTVVIEWSNVSNGYDIAFADPAGLYENGFAYAAVSVQPMGVHGYSGDPHGLTTWDGERYGPLSVSGDGVTYDIFTQAARALSPGRDSKAQGADPLAGLPVKKLIGIGGSQSGNRVLSYTNGVQPIERAFDALMPLVQVGGYDFKEEVAADRTVRSQNRTVQGAVRDDLDIPVMIVDTETESLYFPRQPNTDKFRYWDIPGATHAPTKNMQVIRQKTDRDGLTNSLYAYSASRSSDVLWMPVVEAAIIHVNNWINGGKAPPEIKLTEIREDRKDYVRDEHGNTVGGVRLPDLEVPIAQYIGGPTLGLAGFTVPFSPEKLKRLYPAHADYVAKVKAAAEAARDAGVILQRTVDDYIKRAEAAPIPEQAYPDVVKPIIAK
jgi:hypothetical protein